MLRLFAPSACKSCRGRKCWGHPKAAPSPRSTSDVTTSRSGVIAHADGARASVSAPAPWSRGGPCTRRLPAGENNGAPVKTATSSAQYLLDHIFVYRRDQNLPYKFSDV